MATFIGEISIDSKHKMIKHSLDNLNDFLTPII